MIEEVCDEFLATQNDACLGVAFVVGAEVLFDAFGFPRGANVELAILFVLALIVVLLAGILFVVLVRR
jgi:hypothetical protein